MSPGAQAETQILLLLVDLLRTSVERTRTAEGISSLLYVVEQIATSLNEYLKSSTYRTVRGCELLGV